MFFSFCCFTTSSIFFPPPVELSSLSLCMTNSKQGEPCFYVIGRTENSRLVTVPVGCLCTSHYLYSALSFFIICSFFVGHVSLHCPWCHDLGMYVLCYIQLWCLCRTTRIWNLPFLFSLFFQKVVKNDKKRKIINAFYEQNKNVEKCSICGFDWISTVSKKHRKHGTWK